MLLLDSRLHHLRRVHCHGGLIVEVGDAHLRLIATRRLLIGNFPRLLLFCSQNKRLLVQTEALSHRLLLVEWVGSRFLLFFLLHLALALRVQADRLDALAVSGGACRLDADVRVPTVSIGAS